MLVGCRGLRLLLEETFGTAIAAYMGDAQKSQRWSLEF